MGASQALESSQLEDLVHRHHGALRRYVRYLGAPPALADDVVQDTFLAALTHGFELRDHGSSAAWLRTVARRLLARRAAADERHRCLLEYERAETTYVAALETEGEAEMRRDALRRCLAEMMPRHREALRLRYGEDASNARVALALGIAPSGAESLLVRLRRRLRQCIARKVAP